MSVLFKFKLWHRARPGCAYPLTFMPIDWAERLPDGTIFVSYTLGLRQT